MDDFSLLAVFDRLGLGDLATISELSPRYHDLITQHYIIPIYQFDALDISIRTNENGQVFINRPVIGGSLAKNIEIANETTNNRLRNVKDAYLSNFHHYTNQQKSMITEGFSQTLGILKNFGYLINRVKLVVKDSDDYSDIQEISSHITEYCSKATQSIELHRTFPYNCHDRISFPPATKVAIWYYNDAETAGLDSLELNEKFPKMEHFTLMSNWRLTLNINFPHLTHFDVKEWWDADFNEFLLANPQIRSFKAHLTYDSIDLLELSEMLPNLEILDLKISCGFWYFRNEIIRFPNVKEFSLEIMDPWYAEPVVWIRERLQFIVFDQLERLTVMSNCHNLTSSYVDWIVQQKTVKRLEIGGLLLNSEQITRVVDALPELNEIIYERDMWSHRTTQ